MLDRKTKFEPRILGGVYGEERKGMFDFIDYVINSVNWGYAFVCLVKFGAVAAFFVGALIYCCRWFACL